MTDDFKEQHSKERTKAEAQFRQAQKPQPAAQPTTEGGRAKEDYVIYSIRLGVAGLGQHQQGSPTSHDPDPPGPFAVIIVHLAVATLQF